MADELDKADGSQEPEKPKKAKKTSDGGSLPLMKIIIIGVIVIVVNTILVVLVFKFVLSPTEPASTDPKSAHKVEHKKAEEEPVDEEEEDFFANEKEKITLETGKIITNPRGSNKFCAISFNLTFKPHHDVPHEELKDGSDLMKKLNAKMKAIILGQIGALTIEELDQKRSTLNLIIKDQLKPVFKEYKLFLTDVLMTEYIVQ